MDVHERLTLEESTAQTSLVCEHVQRYELAAALFDGARVLDLCCGSGYGSRILAEAGAEVTGVDRDGPTIDSARTRIGKPHGVKFELSDAVRFLEQRASDFDAIVCFEGLEHLEDLEGALSLLEAFARDGGRVVASVPNSKAFGEENEFHVTDFGFEEAMEAFARFPESQVASQHLIEGGLIVMPGGTGDVTCEMTGADRAELEYANHYILFSNCDLDGIASTARGLLSAAPVHYAYMKSLEVANAELRRANARLARGNLGLAGSASAKHASALELRLAQARAAAAGVDEQRARGDAEHWARVAAQQRVGELEHEVRQLRKELSSGMVAAAVASLRYKDSAT
jgi:2-polyprenyl-3-methyl-5-hydroxy-6-metoxy-1,4-benzoquinol methylase